MGDDHPLQLRNAAPPARFTIGGALALCIGEYDANSGPHPIEFVLEAREYERRRRRDLHDVIAPKPLVNKFELANWRAGALTHEASAMKRRARENLRKPETPRESCAYLLTSTGAKRRFL
jgi:hypothetical protein